MCASFSLAATTSTFESVKCEFASEIVDIHTS